MDELPQGTVTLLFCDIEGSTQLSQQQGEQYSELLDNYRQLLRTIFQHFHGYEVDTQGETFFGVFARASDAISAAVEAQRTLAAHMWPDEGVNVHMRMGLHTGELQVAPGGYVGMVVHQGARMMGAAHGGQVLLSNTTYKLVETDLPDGISLRDLGEYRLNGLESATLLFQLIIPGLPVHFPPLRTLEARSHNLPVQLTPLIGREQDVAIVQRLLLREDVRLVTLTGTGGVGKTRVALQVATECIGFFADGVFLVNLAPISDPEPVLPTIAQALGLREVAGQPSLRTIQDALQQRQILLLLDNFEQVISAAVSVVDLLTACPQLKIMVTSREVLHVRAEHEFAVPPLALPDTSHLPGLTMLSQYAAVALFIERAEAIKPSFQLTTTNASALAEICVHLEGLPLAIELAAARIKLLPPQALLARLKQRLPLLTSGGQDMPVRQQTLRNTIAWSYDLLTPAEQRLFRRLTIFVGGTALEAIEALYTALGGEAEPVLDGLASLMDKSLLQQTVQEGEELRFVMLETIREYGMEVLATSGEWEAARQAHATYYLALAEEAARGYTGPQLAEWLERLEQEHDNLRAAMAWSLDPEQAGSRLEMASQLGEALTEFWRLRNYHNEAWAFLEQVLSCSEGSAASVRARMLDVAASFAHARDDYERAERWWQESLALYRELGDIRGIASSLQGSALIAFKQNKSIAGFAQLEESSALAKESGDPKTIAESLLNLAEGIFFLGGDYRRANVLIEEGLAIYRVLGNKPGIAASLLQSAVFLFFTAQGDEVTIHQRLEELLAISRELGDKMGMGFYYWVEGWIVFRQGDARKAYDLIEKCLALMRETESRWHICGALAYLGRIKAHQGDFAAAHALLEESLAEARTLDDWSRAFCLERLAIVVAAQGEYAWAARLLSVAESLRENHSTPVLPIERADYEPTLAEAHTRLGERAFAAAWVEGQAMTFEQVLGDVGRAEIAPPISADQAPTAPAKRSSTYPAGLTAREVEVLRLVAQGLTDAQMAERLVISPSTVNSHLKSIYGKLQISSRSAATRFAIESHLI